MADGTAALIVAAGSGSRAGGEIAKQYQSLGSAPMISWSLDSFLAHPAVDRVVTVIAAGDERRFEELGYRKAKIQPPVHGGVTRQDSVAAGLAELAKDPPRRVLIHDAARPFVSA